MACRLSLHTGFPGKPLGTALERVVGEMKNHLRRAIAAHSAFRGGSIMMGFCT